MRRTKVCVLALWIEGVFCCLVNAGPTWTTLDYPGAARTNIWGIDGDYIVGTYNMTSSSDQRSFVYDGVTWTTLAAGHYASGVDGHYVVGSTGNTSSFLYDVANHTYSYFGIGGGAVTQAQAIDGHNIVGAYRVGAYPSAITWHGFLYDGTNWTTLDLPGAPAGTATRAMGIDGANIVLSTNHGGVNSGYLYDGVNWTNINIPGSSTTMPYDIEGRYIVGGGFDFGYLYDGTNYTILEAPEARLSTHATDISGNTIVGYYTGSDSVSHGFVYTFDISVVPLPASVLLGVWAVGLVGWRLRRQTE